MPPAARLRHSIPRWATFALRLDDSSVKAVLLAGGLGTRMREETEFRPKPMVEVGGRPVLWHIMKILGHQGIYDFVVCTGYKSEYIKNYFSNYVRPTRTSP